MPPLVFSPLAKIVFGALGGAALVGWVVSEVRWLNEEFERMQTAAAIDPLAREALPTLRRDPQSGEWRIT
jgi:hypothetical protein